MFQAHAGVIGGAAVDHLRARRHRSGIESSRAIGRAIHRVSGSEGDTVVPVAGWPLEHCPDIEVTVPIHHGAYHSWSKPAVIAGSRIIEMTQDIVECEDIVPGTAPPSSLLTNDPGDIADQ